MAEIIDFKKPSKGVDDATEYLCTGGLGEVIGLASASMQYGHPKVQMDTDMAIALCMLADETIKRRKSH